MEVDRPFKMVGKWNPAYKAERLPGFPSREPPLISQCYKLTGVPPDTKAAYECKIVEMSGKYTQLYEWDYSALLKEKGCYSYITSVSLVSVVEILPVYSLLSLSASRLEQSGLVPVVLLPFLWSHWSSLRN